jgi:hypothetical protein
MEDINLTCVTCKKVFVWPVHEQKFFEKNGFVQPKRCRACRPANRLKKETTAPKSDGLNGDKNWDVSCMVCGAKPTVGNTELCGPCCFGDASTIGGNW